MKEIAIKGKFSLRYKNYIDPNHIAGLKDIAIVKWQNSYNENKLSCYTIAGFNEDGELVSCGDRLLDSMECFEDVEDVKFLSFIGQMIINGDNQVALGD